MSMSVCLSVRTHISETTRPNLTNVLCLFSVALARSYSGDVVICHVLPVLWMTNLCYLESYGGVMLLQQPGCNVVSAGASIPMGQGRHAPSPNIYEGGRPW